MKVLPEELIGPYLHEAKQRGVFAPLYLELTSGLRRGELLALLWKDLNVKERTLSVTKSVCRIDHQLVVSQPKTKNSLRLLTLPECKFWWKNTKSTRIIPICSRPRKPERCSTRHPSAPCMTGFWKPSAQNM